MQFALEIIIYLVFFMEFKTLVSWYKEQVRTNTLDFDKDQLRIATVLDDFVKNFNTSSDFIHWIFNAFRKLFSYKGGCEAKYGYYIYGSVGRGKTMIIDKLYSILPTSKKLRLHFHEFMQYIHEELSNQKNFENPITKVVGKLATQYKIIFLDEMHVNDIATAMILSELFEQMFKKDIYLITTSNYEPKQLYKDGLMRERFLSAIELIERKLNILSLDSSKDYRYKNTNLENKRFFIHDHSSRYKLEEIFQRITKFNKIEIEGKIIVKSRAIKFIKKSDNIIWFRFEVICGNRRSQLDYLELAKNFKYFIIEEIPELSQPQEDSLRRFILLIDVLYDNRCNLIITSKVDINEICSNVNFQEEFKRTLSRLNEMQG